MTNRAQHRPQPIPAWVWAIIVVLSSLIPLTFAWIACFPPAGTVPTGIHGVDGAVFIACMRMFATDFFAPFANCHSPLGMHASAYFAAPFFWMYGIIGAAGHALHINEFLMLGIANGIGGFLYLLAAYLFLREAFPKQAPLAFVLFALAGGPGGILYVITWALGLHDSPSFEPYFYRYALYQLFEGARPSPVLTMPRLYYTTSMACCLASLTCFLQALRQESARRTIEAAGLLFLGTFINLRYGPMMWGIVVLYLAADHRLALRKRLRLGLAMLVPVALAWGLGWLMLRRSPAYVEGAMAHIRTHMWLSPFVCAVLFHFAVVPQQTVRGVRSLRGLARAAAHAAIGYLIAYASLYIAYNAYYGNLWLCLDVTSAVRISDWAILGALAGGTWSLLRSRDQSAEASEDGVFRGWIALWMLGFLSVSISAFGHGWFIRLVPERAMIFLSLPIAVLAAIGIQQWQRTRPRQAHALLAVMLVSGACAILVSSTCFQGVLEHRPGHGPFAYPHCELVSIADADAMASVDQGVVLTPVTYGPSFGDVFAQRPNTSVVFGFGSVNLSDRDSARSKQQCETFFTAGTPESVRKQIVDDWCVNFVYCPDAYPVNPNVLEALRATPWLNEIAHSGNAVVFRVLD